MTERNIPQSAVVILETKDSFVLERRPNLPGKLAYPGKLQLFGGGYEEGEDGPTAAARELDEELGLKVDPAALHEQWTGKYESRGKNDEPMLRHVSLYELGLAALGRESLHLNVKGEIADVPKTLEALEAQKDEFTPFALATLRRHIEGGYDVSAN